MISIGRAEERVAKLVDSPDRPESEASYKLDDGGWADVWYCWSNRNATSWTWRNIQHNFEAQEIRDDHSYYTPCWPWCRSYKYYAHFSCPSQHDTKRVSVRTFAGYIWIYLNRRMSWEPHDASWQRTMCISISTARSHQRIKLSIIQDHASFKPAYLCSKWSDFCLFCLQLSLCPPLRLPTRATGSLTAFQTLGLICPNALVCRYSTLVKTQQPLPTRVAQ